MTATHILLDIEALGLTAGSAIIELAAVAFCPETGKIGETFTCRIAPETPFTADLATLEWHRKQGTFPHPLDDTGISLRSALTAFVNWVSDIGYIDAFWSWGSTYDFPLLAPAFNHHDLTPPWKYHQCRCARTVWQLAFPDVRHAQRPHIALEDAKAAARDLISAIQWLRSGKEGA